MSRNHTFSEKLRKDRDYVAVEGSVYFMSIECLALAWAKLHPSYDVETFCQKLVTVAKAHDVAALRKLVDGARTQAWAHLRDGQAEVWAMILVQVDAWSNATHVLTKTPCEYELRTRPPTV